MRALSLVLATENKAKYLKIADAIRNAIRQGHIAPKEVFPSSRQLALTLATNRHTVMAAFSELIAEGWVESTERSAYRVVALLPVEKSIATAPLKTIHKFK